MPSWSWKLGLDIVREEGQLKGPRRLNAARRALQVVAPDLGRARRGVHEAGEDVDQRRFAGAVGPEQPEQRSARNVEIDAVERRQHGAALSGAAAAIQLLDRRDIRLKAGAVEGLAGAQPQLWLQHQGRKELVAFQGHRCQPVARAAIDREADH